MKLPFVAMKPFMAVIRSHLHRRTPIRSKSSSASSLIPSSSSEEAGFKSPQEISENTGVKPNTSIPENVKPPIRSPEDFGEEDLASEESLWSLYERWMEHYAGHYAVPKDLDKKGDRFNRFKKTAKHVHEFNKEGHSCTLCLNMFAVSGPPHGLIPDRRPKETNLGNYEIFLDSQPPQPPIYFGENDLASEESLWNLYERWMAHWNNYYVIPKDNKKGKRFNAFKKNAKYIHDFDKNRKSSTMSLTIDAASDMEMQPGYEDTNYQRRESRSQRRESQRQQNLPGSSKPA